MSTKKNFVIAIGRQFGSGGRDFGQRLARALGIEFYDKRLLPEAAKAAGMDVSFFEQADERFPSFVSGSIAFNIGYNPMPWYTASSISDETLNRHVSDLITGLASRGSCVIVGRTADYVLRDHPDAEVISIFVHASMDDRISRIIGRGDCADPKAARSLAEKRNKLRAEYYNFYTDRHWGDAATYDLTLNSSLLTMDQMVDLARHYITLRRPH